MDFIKATDRLMQAGVGLGEIAAALGVAYGSVKAARLDPSSSSYRSPPAGWPEALAALARQRGEELLELSREIEEQCG